MDDKTPTFDRLTSEPTELTAEQVALVAGGSPKGTWLDFFSVDAWCDLLASPKGTW
jgi:hypothetical protein